MRLAPPPPSHFQKPHSPFGNNTLGNLVCLMASIDRLTAVCVVAIQQNQTESSLFQTLTLYNLQVEGMKKVLTVTTNLYYYYSINLYYHTSHALIFYTCGGGNA